jgi:hypothetical protein
MGERTTLSGHIQEPYYVPGSDRSIARLYHYNRRAIRSLSKHDDWPFLTRQMFSASPIAGQGPGGRLLAPYRGPIHFGWSFKGVWDDWPTWLDKFESLLRRMYWEHVVLILVTEFVGQHLYQWEADLQGFSADAPTPIHKWNFHGGPRDFHAPV